MERTDGPPKRAQHLELELPPVLLKSGCPQELIKKVPPAGIEPAAFHLGGGRSIRLSYEGYEGYEG